MYLKVKVFHVNEFVDKRYSMESASKCLKVLQKHIAIWPVLEY